MHHMIQFKSLSFSKRKQRSMVRKLTKLIFFVFFWKLYMYISKTKQKKKEKKVGERASESQRERGGREVNRLQGIFFLSSLKLILFQNINQFKKEILFIFFSPLIKKIKSINQYVSRNTNYIIKDNISISNIVD